MARSDFGTVTVAVSGTARQLIADTDSSAIVQAGSRVLSIEISVRDDSGGTAMHFGATNRAQTGSTVTTTYGRRIKKGTTFEMSFDPHTVSFQDFYMDADTGGSKADWSVVIEE